MKVNIVRAEDDVLLDSNVKVIKEYSGDWMLDRKGKRRFEFQNRHEKNDFWRGYIKCVVGYLKGQRGYEVVRLVGCFESTESPSETAAV